MKVEDTVPSPRDDQRRDVMKAPDDVSAMLRLKTLGWGSKRIAAELGCSRMPASTSRSMAREHVSGAFNKAKGAVKEVVGKVTGSKKMEAEGKLDNTIPR